MNKQFVSGFLAVTLISITCTGVSAEELLNAQRYRLRMFHTHTGRQLDVVYRVGNRYAPEALSQLNEYLRDHRTGDVRQYDPRVFDLIHDLVARVGRPDSKIDIVCGFRSPSSNAFLRTHSQGVASHSLHMRAMAIDIRIPGVKTSDVRDAALSLRRGGLVIMRSRTFCM